MYEWRNVPLSKNYTMRSALTFLIINSLATVNKKICFLFKGINSIDGGKI